MPTVDPAMLGHFKSHYVERLRLFISVFKERFLQSFGPLEEECQTISDEFWTEWNQAPGYADADPGSAADTALQLGVTYYQALMGARQAYINLASVGLYHAWEQQVLEFFGRYVVTDEHIAKVKEISMQEFVRVAAQAGIPIATFQSTATIKTLKNCANAVKHAEGDSAEKLRAQRPELFRAPVFHGIEQATILTNRKLYAPLSGDDLYLTVENLDEFLEGTIQFWVDMTIALQTTFKGNWFPT